MWTSFGIVNCSQKHVTVCLSCVHRVMQQPVSAQVMVTSQGDATHVDETTQKAAAMIQAGDSDQATGGHM